MSFSIFVAFPPDREGKVAELSVRHDGVVDVPAELFHDDGRLMISLCSRNDGVAWTYPLTEFLAAIDSGVAALDAPRSAS